ncbi:hypothetical protein QU39_00085, partial [Staphylococcus aureus]
PDLRRSRHGSEQQGREDQMAAHHGFPPKGAAVKGSPIPVERRLNTSIATRRSPGKRGARSPGRPPFPDSVREGSAVLVRAAHAGAVEVLRHEVPVDDVRGDRLEIFRTQVAIVDVIGVLPHVDREERLHALIE